MDDLSGRSASRQRAPHAKLVMVANPTWLLLPICRALRRVPAPAAAAAGAALIAAGVAEAVVRRDRLLAIITAAPNADHLAALALLIWVLGFAHELAHAAAAVLAGGRVSAIGLAHAGWRVAFFVELPDLARLPRRAQAWVAAAGPLADAGIGCGALLLARFFTWAADAALLVAGAALARAAWNLLPLYRTDGAYLAGLLRSRDLAGR